MKKILLTLMCICAIHFSNAQYWQIPNVAAGENPRGLNKDTEQPGPAGWTSILATSATPTWSAAINIPFAFQFNGAAVTQFMASSTGVVTFDVATTLSAPSTTNTALPSAAIPDKSVCVWGLSGTGANDAILTKTFGTAPNRQFWIQYNSYSYPANAAAWCYWSVVLEESSNMIHIVDHRSASNSGPVTIAITAGIQINGTTAHSVAGSPSLGTAAPNSADDPSDNSYYTFIPGTQPADDIVAISSNGADYVTVGTNLPIDFKVRNYGSNTITSYVIKYQDGANTPVSQNVTGVSIPSMGFNTTTFTTPYNVTAVGIHNLKVWAELPGDVNHANDTTKTVQSGVGFMPKKVLTMEEPTGTWCGWCTRGIVYMDSIHLAQPSDVAVISVHNGDPMTISAYDNHITAITGGGWPNLTVDRKFVGDPSDAFTAYNDMKGSFGFAEITQSHTSTGPAYTVNVDVKPATDLAGDYRLALIVTENSVHGSGSAWNQANYYSFQSQNLPLSGGGINYQTSPNPIPAAQMFYNFVPREIVGTPQGQVNSLPATMMYNQTYSHTFNYTVPATSNANKMQLIVLMIDNATGNIVNASIDGFYPVGTADLVKNDNIKIIAYPNPVNDQLSLDMEVTEDLHSASYQITDMMGKVISKVALGNVTKGFMHTYKVDASSLSSGTYMISVIGNEGTYSSQFIKK